MCPKQPAADAPDADQRDTDTRDVDLRVGAAWRTLKRSSANATLRSFCFGDHEAAIDAGQMDTLDVLRAKPVWRMCEVAEALRVDPSTATRAVQRLVNVGLAERGADSEDGRVVAVSITDAGRELHRQIDQRRAYVLSQVLAPFSTDERLTLAELLGRFVAQLDSLATVLPDERVVADESTHDEQVGVG